MDEGNLATLESRVKELEGKQAELTAEIEAKENEFGIKRAQFKELFVQKEGELKEEATKLRIAREENAKLLADLQNVSAERDDLKTAILIAQTSSDDKWTAMKLRYQEEIASLRAIIDGAVMDARQETTEQYEVEHRRLMTANQELENKLLKYKTQVRQMRSQLQQQQQQQQDDDNDGLFDVLSKKVQTSTTEPNVETDENLEDSMKKAQEDAETLRSIVMPLEEEIVSLKSKLKNANDKMSLLEIKQKQVKPPGDVTLESSCKASDGRLENLEEKIKELSQYLEAERSARTDLEMFVAVLNTQKGVLQEDAEKLRKELHNVCRLLEQEKEEHVALKDTWEMANDRFLETQRAQKIQMDKIKKILTPEQLQIVEENAKEKKENVQLLTPPSPGTVKRFLHRKSNKQNMNRKDIIKSRPSSSEPKRSLASLVRNPKSSSLPSSPSSILDSEVPQIVNNSSPLIPSAIPPESNTSILVPSTTSAGVAVSALSVECDRLSLREFSDGETSSSQALANTMRKYKSADDLKSELSQAPKNSSRSRSEEFNVLAKDLDVKRGKGNIDWKSFEEAAKSSLSNDIARACAMCSNYEKQLQKLQQRNEDLSDETSALSKKLQEEQETVITMKRTCEKLEQSIVVASEDAQAQINVAMETQGSFESLLEEITTDIQKTKKDITRQMTELMLSRDNILAKYEQLSENSRSLPSARIDPVNQSENFDQAALQSEINFMKDRVVAEQIAKESMEELYQAEIESLGKEIKSLKQQLVTEGHQTKQGENYSESVGSGDVITMLKQQLQKSAEHKSYLENQVQQLKSQLHSLNGQLNNSEAVQRDFVKLSQSLQMKLEEMRESQKDLKQEDDVDTSSQECEKRPHSSDTT